MWAWEDIWHLQHSSCIGNVCQPACLGHGEAQNQDTGSCRKIPRCKCSWNDVLKDLSMREGGAVAMATKGSAPIWPLNLQIHRRRPKYSAANLTTCCKHYKRVRYHRNYPSNISGQIIYNKYICMAFSINKTCAKIEKHSKNAYLHWSSMGSLRKYKF